MTRTALALALLAFALCGCEPLRGVVSQKDVGTAVDTKCIDKTLRQAFGKVERWDYVADGNTFPNGTSVAQFAYYNWNSAGWVTLDVGRVNGKTRVSHSFTGIGPELPQQSFPPAIRAMQKAGEVLRMACNLDLSSMKLRAVGQSVEALN
ncbi:hypothetical protein [Sphingomonas sp. ID0503]|uniref:hypothetical protein n=1 Tax=Sphingomonas sp. ID0503 TaxID=3399691 RepID=UPI003AFB0412